jgi:F-type H+-transporting ATPase subunit delta
MKTPRTRIANLVAQRSLKSGVNKPLSREVAAYLMEENRTDELYSILRDVQEFWAEAGQLEVIATTARPLTAAAKTDIQKKIKTLHPNAKNIIISEVIDPELVGGVRLNLPGQQLDYSVEAKLNKFKQLSISGKD